MVWHIRRGWRDDHAEIENAIMLGAFKQTTEMFHGFLSNRNCESCGQTSDTISLNIEIELFYTPRGQVFGFFKITGSS
jgi:hypothetical protein